MSELTWSKSMRVTNAIRGRIVRAGRRLMPTRVILDHHCRLNYPVRREPTIETSINKEEASRAAIFDNRTPGGRFLEVGCGDGALTYLLGIRTNLSFDSDFYAHNRRRFQSKFEYIGLDLGGATGADVIAGDICSPTFLDEHPELVGQCAVVYSNNVFEHLRHPWMAARSIVALLKNGGVVVTVVPFAQRYHESPADYFRYTHKGLEALFADVAAIEVLRSGYDILGRRNDWQGSGEANDVVPMDEFGAWRETWFTFLAFRKAA